jgi:hypothetical protein
VRQIRCQPGESAKDRAMKANAAVTAAQSLNLAIESTIPTARARITTSATIKNSAMGRESNHAR